MERVSMSTWVPTLNVSMYVADNFWFPLGIRKVKMKEVGVGSPLKQVLNGRLGINDMEQFSGQELRGWEPTSGNKYFGR